MRRSQQAFSAPSKQTQSSNAKDELSSTASINASSTTLIPSSELLASKPRDSTLKREQNSCYEYAPLTAVLLSPIKADAKLECQRRTQLDRLYQRVIDALDTLCQAVGVKAA